MILNSQKLLNQDQNDGFHGSIALNTGTRWWRDDSNHG